LVQLPDEEEPEPAVFAFFAWRFSFSDLLAAVFELFEPPLSLLAMVASSRRSDPGVERITPEPTVRPNGRRLTDRTRRRVVLADFRELATFTERLDDASLHDVLPRMAALVAQGTGAERVRIWLRDATELRAVAAWPPDGVLPSPMRLDDGELPGLDDRAFAGSPRRRPARRDHRWHAAAGADDPGHRAAVG
jgi:hypothetical protein